MSERKSGKRSHALRRDDISTAKMFVICSERSRSEEEDMKRPVLKALITLAALCALTGASRAAPPEPWELKPSMGYAYGKDGTTLAYKMGTKNADMLLKGAKKVPKGTLFFVGQNGQLYMRTAPYLEGDGSFSFGADE